MNELVKNSIFIQCVNAVIWYNDTCRLQADAKISRCTSSQSRPQPRSRLFTHSIQFGCCSGLKPRQTHTDSQLLYSHKGYCSV